MVASLRHKTRLSAELINQPQAVVEEMVEGLAAVYPGLCRLPGLTVLSRSDLGFTIERIYLGERALGHPDPGAEAVAVALSALSEQFNTC